MFGQPRERMLEGIGLMGARACGYTSPPYSSGVASTLPNSAVERWLKVRCDCKYGGNGRGEQTGCPELRLMYAVLNSLTDNEWEQLVEDKGGAFLTFRQRQSSLEGAVLRTKDGYTFKLEAT